MEHGWFSHSLRAHTRPLLSRAVATFGTPSRASSVEAGEYDFTVTSSSRDR